MRLRLRRRNEVYRGHGRFGRRRVIAVAALAVALGATAPVRGQDGHFVGKTITIYVGNAAGGTYDLIGRLVARHLGSHLPSSPTVIVENMPGAGTLRAANYVANVVPKNGTALGIVSETIAVEQALQNSAVQYDAAKLTWIGRVAAANGVYIVWHTAKAQSIEDAEHVECTIAGTGPGNVGEAVPKLLNAVIGTKFRIVGGYQAANDALLAVERGEVDGAATNWTTLKTAKLDWLRESKIKVILQDLPARAADLPDVPALGELGGDAESSQLLGLYANTGAIGRAVFAPADVAPSAAKALRDGFAAMTQDPDFLADAQHIGAELDIGTGADALKAVQLTLNLPPAVLQRAHDILRR